MANELIITNGFISNSSSRIIGTLSATTISASVYTNIPTFTGGTVSGETNFTNGLTANTFSAATYLGDTTNFDYYLYSTNNLQSFHNIAYGLTNFPIQVNFLGIIPIYIKKEVTIDILNIFIQAASAGNAVFGIYDSINSVPNDLLFQTTPFDNSVISSQTYTLTSPLTLKRGIYYIGYNSSSAASYRSCQFSASLNIFGIYNANAISGSVLFKPLTYTGTLPSNWNSFAGTISGVNAGTSFPHVAFRIV